MTGSKKGMDMKRIFFISESFTDMINVARP
jgi:hypothetical protein